MTVRCPYCDGEATIDEVDVGVGMVPMGNYGCDACQSVKLSPEDRESGLYSDEELHIGWSAPVDPDDHGEPGEALTPKRRWR